MRTLGRFLGVVLLGALLLAMFMLYEHNRTQLGGESLGQKIDRGVERSGQAVSGTGGEVARAAREHADRVRDAAAQARDGMRDRASAGIERGAEKIGAAQAAVQGRLDRTSDALSDTAIIASINADILKDPGLSTRRIEVLARQGEVTLRGIVESELARQRAERMAGAVAGVTRVDNQLVVAGGVPLASR